jgi:hypothetical protein
MLVRALAGRALTAAIDDETRADLGEMSFMKILRS